jgi:hypothetical protein
MLASAHVAAGLFAGVVTSRTTAPPAVRAVLAFVAGVLTHVVLDAVPHSDYVPLSRLTATVVALCETAITAAVGAWLVRGRLPAGSAPLLIAAIVGATLPDAKFGAALISAEVGAVVREYGNTFHESFHATERRPLGKALMTEIGTAVSFLAAVWLVARRRARGDRIPMLP